MSAATPAGQIIAAGLVDRMQAIWPSSTWKAETCQEYVRVLEDVPDYIARHAIEALKGTARRRPSIAELQDGCRAAWAHYSGETSETSDEPDAPRLPTSPARLLDESRETGRRGVALARQRLQSDRRAS